MENKAEMVTFNRPHFIIIGAMKSATSTLHNQLSLQAGFFMSNPKEPNFFSDDVNYGKGAEHYLSLFNKATAVDLCGESSTHYTKLPTYPNTISRISTHLKDTKLIYIIREPIDRLISQYIHEWSVGTISSKIDDAIHRHPELIYYSKYGMQIRPYLENLPNPILLVFYEALTKKPQTQLEHIASFLGAQHPVKWRFDIKGHNQSKERMRLNPTLKFIIDNPMLTYMRRKIIPEKWRRKLSKQFTMQSRPSLSSSNYLILSKTFNEDLLFLKQFTHLELTCSNWNQVTSELNPIRIN